MNRVPIEEHGAGGLLWAAGWLFTVGFLQLSFGKALAAIIAWPYFIGAAAAAFIR